MTSTVTIRLDPETKKKAEYLLDQIGLNWTTFLGSATKALIRERRVPFELGVTSPYEPFTSDGEVDRWTEDMNAEWWDKA
jgi:addiction module RelB/DinJ family antitoxin